MKILLDMNLSPRWVKVLGEAGFESKHWSELGPVDASDQEIMSLAARLSFVVLTHDLDFSAILAAAQGTKPSVVQIRARNLSPEIIEKKVVSALRLMSSELENGALLTVDADSARLRVLPLKPSIE